MSWAGKNDLKTLADFFENGGKNLRFQKYPDTYGQAKTILKTLRVDAEFFEKGRKKAPFRKISGYAWTGPKIVQWNAESASTLGGSGGPGKF